MLQKPISVAVVVDEYFGGAGTAFGGYGFLARHIVCRYLPSPSVTVDVLLPRRRRHWHLYSKIELIDGIAVIRPPSKMWLPFWLLARGYDAYLTIESTHDAWAFDPRPWKRIVHWVQDPRPWYVWRKIQTMTLLVEHCFFSPRLNDAVARAHRRGDVRFISQGASLNDYARDLYALPDDVPIDIVRNPVPDDDASDSGHEKENLIVFLGRLESQKRVWLFCEIARRMPQYRFVVIGKFHRDSKLNQTVLTPYTDGKVSNLELVGQLEGDAKQAYLKRAKILLNTSIWEGIPLSFLEALSVGTLVVSNVDPDGLVSRFGCHIGECLGDGFEGVDAFVTAIEALLRDEERRRSLSSSAVQYVREHHSIGHFQTRMRAILLEEAAIAQQKKRALGLVQRLSGIVRRLMGKR